MRVGERQQLVRAPRPATNRPLDCLPLLLGSSSVSTPLLTRVLSSNPVPTLPNPDPHQVSALSELAYTEAKLRARRRRGDAGGLLHLRTAVVELLQAVLHAHKAAVEASWRG